MIFVPAESPAPMARDRWRPFFWAARAIFFGTTGYGGANGQYGTVFRLMP